MKLINSKKSIGFLTGALFLLILSCNVNTLNKSEVNSENQENLITRNREDAKLLVTASKNYIELIDYCNFLKDTVVKNPNEKVLINSIVDKISVVSNNLKEISSKELVLLPKESDFNLSYQKYINQVKNTDIVENKTVFYEKLNTMIETQIGVMEILNKESKNFSLHILADESKDILSDYNSEIERLIK